MFGLLCESLSAGSDGMRMMCCHGDADVMSFLLLYLFIYLFLSGLLSFMSSADGFLQLTVFIPIEMIV